MSEEHVTSDEIERLRSGTVGVRRLAAIGAHLRTCTACAAQLEPSIGKRTSDLVRHVSPPMEAVEPAPRRSYWPLAAGIALLVGLAAAFAYFAKREQLPLIATTTTTTTTIAPPPRPAVPPVPTTYGRAEWNAWMREAAAARRIEIPAALLALRPAAMSFRGDNGATPPKSVGEPTGMIVRSARPTFVWSALRGATSVVQIHNDRGVVATSEPTTAQRWTPKRDLPRGETYSWQVTVSHDGQQSVIPAPPAPPALFRILGAKELAEIEAAERAFASDDRFLAVLYARHGLQAEAIAAMKRHVARNPTPEAHALLESLRSWPPA